MTIPAAGVRIVTLEEGKFAGKEDRRPFAVEP
jgi:hypothetical protein